MLLLYYLGGTFLVVALFSLAFMAIGKYKENRYDIACDNYYGLARTFVQVDLGILIGLILAMIGFYARFGVFLANGPQ